MKHHITILAVFLFFFSMQVYAGGFEVPDNGTKSIGRGGAFLVKGNDLSLVNYNPACLSNLKGVTFFYNHNFINLNLSFKRAPATLWEKTGPHTEEETHVDFPEVSNQKKWFLLGAMFGFSYDFGLKNLNFAFSVFGPSAVGSSEFALNERENEKDPVNPTQYMFIKKDILLLYYTLTTSYKFSEKFSVGLNLQWVDMPYSKFEMMVDGNEEKTIYPIGSPWDVLVKVDTKDRFTPSFTFGMLYKPFSFLEFSFSSRPLPIYLESKGKLNLEFFGETIKASEDWKLANNDIVLNIVLPPWIKTGVRYVKREGESELFDIEFDFTYEWWSLLENYDVSVDAKLSLYDFGKEVVIKDLALPKHYKNTFSLRLGGDYQVISKLLWIRLGGYFESAAVPKEYTNLDFVNFNRLGLGAGFTVRIFRKVFLNGGYLHVFQETRNVSIDETQIFQQRPGQICESPYTDETKCDKHYLGKPGAPVGGGTYKSSYNIISFGVNGNF